jgi:hypothetical protein
VHIAFDVPNTPSGGNSRSGFAFMKTVRQLPRSIVSKAPPGGSIKNIDAFRSSKQAAPVTCFFQNKRVDKCNPAPEHVPSNWHPTAPLPHSFKCRYDPVHKAICNRDRPVPLALCIIRVAELMHAPRPHIFSRQTNNPQTSGGGHNGDLN